jgi:hypothetical protein
MGLIASAGVRDISNDPARHLHRDKRIAVDVGVGGKYEILNSPIPKKESGSARVTVLADAPASRPRPPRVAARRVMLMTILQFNC